MFPENTLGVPLVGDVRTCLPLRQVLGQMKLNLLRVDPTGSIVEVHDGFCQMTGYSENELLGMKAVELLWDASDQDFMVQRGLERRRGEVSTYEIAIRGRNGNQIWVSVGGYPVFDLQGNFEGSIGLHLDITQQKEQAERLTYLNAYLEAEVERKVDEIMDLYRRMEGIQERERRNLASELHDDIGHSLLLQKMEIERLKDEVESLMNGFCPVARRGVMEMVDRLTVGSGHLIKKVRQLSHSIFPPELQYGTLVDAMEARMGYLFSYHGIKYDLLVSDAFHDPAPQIKLLLYRSFQEAVNNAIRHANAMRIGVVLRRVSGEIDMEVWNDCMSAQGLQTCREGGLGRLSIQERLLPWKGRLVTTTIDERFVMKITIPEAVYA